MCEWGKEYHTRVKKKSYEKDPQTKRQTRINRVRGKKREKRNAIIVAACGCGRQYHTQEKIIFSPYNITLSNRGKVRRTWKNIFPFHCHSSAEGKTNIHNAISLSTERLLSHPTKGMSSNEPRGTVLL